MTTLPQLPRGCDKNSLPIHDHQSTVDFWEQLDYLRFQKRICILFNPSLFHLLPNPYRTSFCKHLTTLRGIGFYFNGMH